MVAVKASETSVPMGPCKLVLMDATTGEELAIIDRTKGGVKFAVTLSTENITMDQTADSPVDVIHAGVNPVLTVPMVTKHLAIIQKTTPGSTLYKHAATGEEAVEVCSTAGASLLANALKVRCEPIYGGPSEHVTLFLAIPIPEYDTSLGAKDVHIKNIRFTGLSDQTKRNRAYLIGPESALPV